MLSDIERVQNIVKLFRQAMEQAAIVTQVEIIPGGTVKRFHVEGDRSGTENGWYILHADPCPVGMFGSWRTDFKHTWKLAGQKPLNREGREAQEKRMAELRAEVKAETERRQAKARREAEAIWKDAQPASKDHPYLAKKQIKPHLARTYKEWLVLPLRDADGGLHSLQFVCPLGKKRFLCGGRVTGCCCGLGNVNGRIYLAEGYATGATIHEVTGEAVAVAFNAGNLKPAAEELRRKHPKTELVIAADNDQWTEGNPGETKALEAARAVNAKVIVPRFSDTLTHPTDFNDLFSLQGAEEVKKQLTRACPPDLLTHVPGILASEVKPEEVDWLWRNYIPLGAMTLLDGDPGRGKSCITLDLAARVTRGWRMPDGSEAELPPRGAVVISLEDSISRAIVPRLSVAGADLQRVRIIDAITGSDGAERVVTVSQDVQSIEKATHDVDAALVILDPVMAVFDPQTNTWKDQEVRRALVPLIKVCERRNIALLVLRHLNKAKGCDPLYRGGGSIAFIGAARAAFMVGKDRDSQGGYVLAYTKSNYAPEVPSLRYRIEGNPGPPHIVWEGETAHSAADLLDDSEAEEERGSAKEAEEFIRGILASGRVPAKDVFLAGKREGHSEKTLKRVKRKLSVRSVLEGQGKDGRWWWELPEEAKANPERVNIENLAPSDHVTDINGFGSVSSPERANFRILAPSGPTPGPL